MKVSELIRELQAYTVSGWDGEVFLSSDAEGNHISPIAEDGLVAEDANGPICDCCEADSGEEIMILYPI